MKNHTENYETCVLGSINWIKIYVLHTNEKKTIDFPWWWMMFFNCFSMDQLEIAYMYMLLLHYY